MSMMILSQRGSGREAPEVEKPMSRMIVSQWELAVRHAHAGGGGGR